MPAKFQAERRRTDRASHFWALNSDPYITLRHEERHPRFFQIPEENEKLPHIPPRSEGIRRGFPFGHIPGPSRDMTIEIGH